MEITQSVTEPHVAEPLRPHIIPIDQLKPWPGNPNEGDIDDIAASLKEYGQWRPAVVQKSTGQICIGNGMWRAAKERLGWGSIAAIVLDVDDDRARRMLARDNRSRDKATYNDYLLADFLSELADTELGLDGTGYDEAFLDELLVRVEHDNDPATMPLPSTDDDSVEMTPGPTDAHYAETDDQATARAQQVSAIQTQAAQGLAEVVIVMPLDDKMTLLRHLDGLKEHLGEELPTGHLLLKATAVTLAVCDGAATNAPPMQWADLLAEAAR